MDKDSKANSIIPLAGEIPQNVLNENENSNISSQDTIIPNNLSTNLIDNSVSELTSKPQVNQPKKEEMKPPIKPNITRLNPFKKILKLILIPFICFIILLITILVVSMTNLDTKFVKITLYGKIIDKTSNSPIANAKIISNNKQIAQSDLDGNYQSQGLEQGKINILVSADGYDDFQTEVLINKTLLDYRTKLNLSLSSSETGQVYGKLITNIDNYNFNDDSLTINDKSININSDGAFTTNGIKVGKLNLKFKSVNFKDLDLQLNIVSGNNQIEPIKLQAAGDITGDLKSYIREDLVLNTQFYVENVLQNQLDITQEGKYFIRDLEVGKNYKIRVIATGYKTRNYQITIKQGLNQLFNFKLVEDGSAIYQTNLEQSGNKIVQFTKSDYDESNATSIYLNNNFIISDEYLNSTESKLYFLSNKDKYESTFRSELQTPYSIDLNTKQLTPLIKNTTNLGSLYPNFISKKMLNQSLVTSSNNDYSLELMDLSGNARIHISDTSGAKFSNINLSDNGNTIVYQDNSDSKKGLYRYSVDNNTITLIASNSSDVFDTSEDGSKILFSRLNSSTGLNDLVFYDSNSSTTRVLKENFDGKQYRFVKGDNNKIIYFTNRENRDNIFFITIDQNKDDRLTSLTSEYTIKYVYQQSGFIFYLTNRGLYVVDYKKPKNFKLVSTKVVDFTGYN